MSLDIGGRRQPKRMMSGSMFEGSIASAGGRRNGLLNCLSFAEFKRAIRSVRRSWRRRPAVRRVASFACTLKNANTWGNCPPRW